MSMPGDPLARSAFLIVSALLFCLGAKIFAKSVYVGGYSVLNSVLLFVFGLFLFGFGGIVLFFLALDLPALHLRH